MPGWLALTLAVVLVVISQIKINVTNAYSGSLAWTSAGPAPPNAIRDGLFLWWSTAIARADGGRYVQRPVVDPRLLLQLRHRRVVVVATDITFNKGLLKLAPAQPEYRRGMIYNVNPVGVVSFGWPPGCRSAPSSVCWGRRWRRSRR